MPLHWFRFFYEKLLLLCGSKLFLYHSRGETIGCQNNFYLLYFYSSITCLSFLCFFVVGLFSFRAATKSICKSWTWNLIDVCAVGDVFDWKSFPKFYYLICMSFICAIWITLYNIMLFLVVNLYVPYLCVCISQKKKNNSHFLIFAAWLFTQTYVWQQQVANEMVFAISSNKILILMLRRDFLMKGVLYFRI